MSKLKPYLWIIGAATAGALVALPVPGLSVATGLILGVAAGTAAAAKTDDSTHRCHLPGLSKLTRLGSRD